MWLTLVDQSEPVAHPYCTSELSYWPNNGTATTCGDANNCSRAALPPFYSFFSSTLQGAGAATVFSTAGEQIYSDATFELLRATAALLNGTSTDVIAWLGETDRWSAAAKGNYNAKTQGKSFLMTTKLVAYMKNSVSLSLSDIFSSC